MVNTSVAETRDYVRAAGVIAIIRGDFPLESLAGIVDALAQGGVQLIELTLNSRSALEGIALLRRESPQDVLIGAGTVRTATEVEQVIAAGAQFLVSPNWEPNSAARAQALNVLHLPGVFTATEAQAAYAAGCNMVKLFPADVGGPAYLKALRAPLHDIDFVPTGGIDEHNIAAYINAGALAVGLGSALVRSPDQPLDELNQRATRIVQALQTARAAKVTAEQ